MTSNAFTASAAHSSARRGCRFPARGGRCSPSDAQGRHEGRPALQERATGQRDATAIPDRRAAQCAEAEFLSEGGRKYIPHRHSPQTRQKRYKGVFLGRMFTS
jgi:hypothetical protein